MPRSCLWPLLAWLLPLAGALGSRLHLWPWWTGFTICLIGALISLILLVRLPWSRNRYASGLGALPLLLPLLFVERALRMPLTNDVSTDPYHPPQLRWATELRTAQDLPINSAPLKAFERNPGPLFTRVMPADVLVEASDLMQELGWQVRPSPDGLDAVVTTPWFGFQDDVALRIFAGPRETRIDMRSASRQGQSDLGTNRARIEDFLTRLNERLGGAYKPKMMKQAEEQDAH
ncbi:DUF1499 domain-containing protein [Aeromonas australiensis]|uniref:DUF1499 domain-containing protein n=1 Tax=Aeromonas australiensis TaxID=1114880 RepID=UPI001F237821|nr:DUF1499 domain-containing protein [Aeromonas australiensis]MCF3096768.1 DUF1499 domain-containing protein [Aeromonas australiensis]